MFKRKSLKKIFLLIVMLPVGLFIFAWGYNKYFLKIDTAEVDRCYDMLSSHAAPSKDLILDLGIGEDADLKTIIDRLKSAMGLGNYEIWIGRHDDKSKPPAFIKNMAYGVMGIYLYNGITEKREEIDVLVHELGHIYVWKLDRGLLAGFDEEKVVDTSCMFLGMGILTLNGLTDEFFYIPGESYHTAKKFYGYLRPEEFGYLMARYAAEHGIDESNVTEFLNATGRKYFTIGRDYLARRGGPGKNISGDPTGAFWCPACGKFTRISLKDKITGLRCPKCGKGVRPRN